MSTKILHVNDWIFTLHASTFGLQRIAFGPPNEPIAKRPPASAAMDILELASDEFERYFAGKLSTWSVPLHVKNVGTPFQQKVWAALLEIPYGETRSYKEVANAIGHAKAVRAIGQANHLNPLPIIIPCHRVIGHNGKLVGYGGGLPLKEQLLALEAA